MEKFIWSCQPFGSYSFRKTWRKKTGNYMHGSTVPCPILYMCLLSSLLMFGSASLFIIKDGGHASSIKSVKNKENHSCGEGGWCCGENINFGLLNIFEEIPIWEWVLSDRLLFSTRHLIFNFFALLHDR